MTLRARIIAAVVSAVAVSSAMAMMSPAAMAADFCAPVYGSFSALAQPPSCWRPYSDASPFNQPLPTNPRVSRTSSSVVKKMLSYGPLQNLHAGDAGTALDSGRPMYFSKTTDPLFTVHCTEAWGICSIEGHQVRIPDQARVPGAEDKHLTVVDQVSGWEYDFWGVTAKPAGGGRIDIRWGGRAKIDGSGMGSDAVAAQTATMAGVLRPNEIASGQINHALALFVRCDSGKWVFPATKGGLACSQMGQSNTSAPPMGTRFQLNMTETQIAALNIPDWRKPLLRTMAQYGMYVIDTGGTWGIVPESGLATTSFGGEDLWLKFAKANGASYWAPDARWVMNIRDGVDWARYLRVIEPCVSQRTC